ncbi:hypothetical protein [Burkholderia phage vB_BpP_HN03]
MAQQMNHEGGDKVHKPSVSKVRITLTPYWQQKFLLGALHELGVHESYSVDMILTMGEKDFVRFYTSAAKVADVTPTQLKFEYVNITNQPIRIRIRSGGLNNYDEDAS